MGLELSFAIQPSAENWIEEGSRTTKMIARESFITRDGKLCAARKTWRTYFE